MSSSIYALRLRFSSPRRHHSSHTSPYLSLFLSLCIYIYIYVIYICIYYSIIFHFSLIRNIILAFHAYFFINPQTQGIKFISNKQNFSFYRLRLSLNKYLKFIRMFWRNILIINKLYIDIVDKKNKCIFIYI